MRESSTENISTILQQYESLNELYDLAPKSTNEALNKVNKGIK